MPRSNHTKRTSRISFDPDKSLTEQSHAARCDINKILGKFKTTGVLQHVNTRQPIYQNLADAPTFTEANYIIANAVSTFESLPAKLRADFNNSPAEFLQFMDNPENHELLESYGFTTNHLNILPTEEEIPPSKEETPPED